MHGADTVKKDNLEIKWEINAEKCTGCGDCVLICPVKAIKLVKRVASMADPMSCCRESCRICEYHCPEGAITAF